MNNKSRRPFLLLEVLIAMALVVLCVFPLIAPHVFILKAQYQFNAKVALDQSVTRIYGALIEKIYKKEIPWSAFEQKLIFPIDENLKKSAGLDPSFTYRGTYQFSLSRRKGSKEQPFTANVVDLKILFATEEKGAMPLVYDYKFFAARTSINSDPNAQKKTP